MKQSAVYSWRLEGHLKEALAAAARAERTTVAQLLARIVREWLQRGATADDDLAAQCRVREEAAKYLGSVRGATPGRAREASARVQQLIRDKHASRRPH